MSMLREKYLDGLKEIEKWYMFDGVNDEILKIIPLVRNGKFLLMGPYGYGKSLYAYVVGKVFFGYLPEELPMVQLMDELSVYDVFYNMHVPSLMQGEEKIEPRSIITAPFKFVNEFQRGNYKIYNTLLGLFSEGFVSIRDKKFSTEDYVAVLDANPFDSGSVEIPAALMDRITGSVNIRSIPGQSMIDMLDTEPDLDRVKNVLDAKGMRRIWAEVERIEVPDKMRLLMALIHSYFSTCIYGDKAVMDHRFVATMCSSCRYKPEPCAMVIEPLGHRWWKDVIRIARARAYLHGNKEVSVDDVFFSSKYALQHRIRTRERVRTLYQSKEQWIDESLANAKLKLKKVWLPALKGDVKAKKMDERTLSALGV